MGVKLTVELSEDLHRRVEARATRLGVSVSDVVREQLEEFAAGSDAPVGLQNDQEARREKARQRLAELGRRLGAEAERQGLTEEDLIEAMEEDRRAVYEEMYRQRVRE